MNVSDLMHYLSEQPQDAEVVVYVPSSRSDYSVRPVQDLGEKGFYLPNQTWRGHKEDQGEWGYRLDDFGNEDDQQGAVPALYLFTGDEPPKAGASKC